MILYDRVILALEASDQPLSSIQIADAVYADDPNGLGTIEGKDVTDDRRVWRLICIRQARSNAEIVERFHVEDDAEWIVANTKSGVIRQTKSLIDEQQAQAARDAEKADEDARKRAYEEEKQRLRELEASVVISDEDLDATTRDLKIERRGLAPLLHL